MARLRGTALFVLLVALTVACDDGGPTGPSLITPTPVTPVEPVEPEEITITVEAPFPPGRNPRNPGISGVSVTCTAGCEGQQVDTTDNRGQVTLTGTAPLTIRAEKSEYIPAEQRVSNGDRVILGNEWPPETAASRHRLQIPPGTILNWDAVEGLIEGSGGEYYCPVIIIKRYPDRRRMLSVLEHELRHAHQDAVTPGDCLSQNWADTPDGREWVAATTADRDAGRLVASLDEPGQYFFDTPHESEAEYYSYWIRSKDYSDRGVGVENLCFSGKSERCKYMEARHGRRPSSYP